MPDKFSSIADIIDQDPGLTKVKNMIKNGGVVGDFPVIFPDLVKIATAVKVEKKTLLLRVENSVWRSELRLKEKVIVDTINKFFGETRINNVRFIP